MLMVWVIDVKRIDLVGKLTWYLCTCSIYIVYILPSSSKCAIITMVIYTDNGK